jgi:hypothetical protein
MDRQTKLIEDEKDIKRRYEPTVERLGIEIKQLQVIDSIRHNM